jgi:hypothetical protein
MSDAPKENGIQRMMRENQDYGAALSRLQDERAADFAKWFKIIGFGGLTEYQAECPQVIDLFLRELVLWRWLVEMRLIVQEMASTVPGKPYWAVLDVDGECLGEGPTAIEAIVEARKLFP